MLKSGALLYTAQALRARGKKRGDLVFLYLQLFRNKFLETVEAHGDEIGFLDFV
jgi:hypothetical protein